MKKIFKLPVMMLGLMLLLAGFAQKAKAQEDYISLETFYEELAPYGTWMQDPQYGYVWRPDVNQNEFSPYYTDGHWVMTEYGNTWISDYDWGWAPFHYGRWVMNRFNEWIWLPDTVWGPAWVSWRSGGGYYGWAPMGPGFNVDINIGGGGWSTPDDWWIFIPQRNIYDTRYQRYGYRNVTIINRTTIINNTYGRNRNTYYTGPRADDIRRVTRRDVRVYNVSRTDRPGRSRITNNNVNFYNPGRRGGNNGTWGGNNANNGGNNGGRDGNNNRPGNNNNNTNPAAGTSDGNNGGRYGRPGRLNPVRGNDRVQPVQPSATDREKLNQNPPSGNVPENNGQGRGGRVPQGNDQQNDAQREQQRQQQLQLRQQQMQQRQQQQQQNGQQEQDRQQRMQQQSQRQQQEQSQRQQQQARQQQEQSQRQQQQEQAQRQQQQQEQQEQAQRRQQEQAQREQQEQAQRRRQEQAERQEQEEQEQAQRRQQEQAQRQQQEQRQQQARQQQEQSQRQQEQSQQQQQQIQQQRQQQIQQRQQQMQPQSRTGSSGEGSSRASRGGRN